MAVSLTFDAEGCYRALIEKLIKVADAIMEEFYNDAIAGLDADGKEDSERINAIWDETQGYVETQCKFYANALMQSFGTGSAADTGEESYWDEYKKMRTKELGYIFNPSRPTSAIRGRPKIDDGKYTNIFGEEQTTTGLNAGKNIETLHIEDKNGNYIQIKPMIPQRSIQNAERWLLKNHQRRVEDRIEEEVKMFFAEEAKNFFVQVNI